MYDYEAHPFLITEENIEEIYEKVFKFFEKKKNMVEYILAVNRPDEVTILTRRPTEVKYDSARKLIILKDIIKSGMELSFGVGHNVVFRKKYSFTIASGENYFNFIRKRRYSDEDFEKATAYWENNE